MTIALHKRQFCIARAPYRFGPDWHHIDLPDGFALSYQADLPIQRIVETDGDRLIIGRSFSSVSGSLAKADLAGRFAILKWPYIQTDAAGLMALYFGGTEPQPFVTSSPTLAARMQSGEWIPIRLQWKVGLNWIPSPGSRVAGVTRILRDQVLNIPTLAVEFRPRPVIPCGSTEESRQILTSGLIHVLKSVEAAHGKVYLALTAGLDSRTLFAALLAGGAKFEAITQSFPGVDPGDLQIPVDLCRYAGIRHSIVSMEQPIEQAIWALNSHSGGSVDDADDHYLIPGNSYRFLNGNCALVRGGCFEIGRRFYQRKLGDLRLSEVTGEHILSRFKSHRNEKVIQFLEEWLAWRRDHGNGLDLTDSFYIDQRLGGWLSAVEQALDVLPGTSVQPVNCERFFSALITPSHEERQAGFLQREVIRVLDKNLLNLPINPVRLQGRLLKAVSRSKSRMKSAIRWVHRWPNDNGVLSGVGYMLSASLA